MESRLRIWTTKNNFHKLPGHRIPPSSRPTRLPIRHPCAFSTSSISPPHWILKGNRGKHVDCGSCAPPSPGLPVYAALRQKKKWTHCVPCAPSKSLPLYPWNGVQIKHTHARTHTHTQITGDLGGNPNKIAEDTLADEKLTVKSAAAAASTQGSGNLAVGIAEGAAQEPSPHCSPSLTCSSRWRAGPLDRSQKGWVGVGNCL